MYFSPVTAKSCRICKTLSTDTSSWVQAYGNLILKTLKVIVRDSQSYILSSTVLQTNCSQQDFLPQFVPFSLATQRAAGVVTTSVSAKKFAIFLLGMEEDTSYTCSTCRFDDLRMA